MKRRLLLTLVAALLCLGLFTPTSAYALTGTGLPSGCSGSVSRYEASYPLTWTFSGTHMELIYKLDNHNYCWVSHLGRVNTDWAEGGADAWQAVLRNDYYSSGRDRLEVLVPTTFWYPYYLYYKTIGLSDSDAFAAIANLFWVWAYYK